MSNDWKTRTKLVHAGTRRSQYGEVSEAIFLTQGFVYDSAEQAEARFIKAGEDEFIAVDFARGGADRGESRPVPAPAGRLGVKHHAVESPLHRGHVARDLFDVVDRDLEVIQFKEHQVGQSRLGTLNL